MIFPHKQKVCRCFYLLLLSQTLNISDSFALCFIISWLVDTHRCTTSVKVFRLKVKLY